MNHPSIRARFLRYALVVLLMVAAAPVWTSPASALQPADGQQRVTGMDRPTDLDPVEARRLRFLFWAYNVIWLALAVYVFSLWARLRSVEREMHQLEGRLQQSGGPRTG